MTKSRSLADLSERRLQSLLVYVIVDWKLGFSSLLPGQRVALSRVPMGSSDPALPQATGK